LKYKFSLPIYPDLTPDYIQNTFIPFLIKYKDYIYDLYFTVRMPPFEQDAMGTIFSKEDIISNISNAIIIQKETNIPISPVFNNIHISPSEENLDLFIKNFRFLYNAGIRTITIPFTSWLYFGKIQKEFPELYIKNTVLRALDKPREIYNAFMAGFDYVNLDRNLMRSQNLLKDIDDARKYAESKLNKSLKLSILWNENCIGNCPIQAEHYTYNVHNNLENQKKVFFKSSMYNVSCYKWEKENPSYGLKKSSIIPSNDFISGLECIDVYKLHGRESKNVFLNSCYIIENIAKNNIEYLQNTNEFFRIKKKYKISNIKFDNWITATKTCNFDCWKCSKCEDLLND